MLFEFQFTERRHWIFRENIFRRSVRINRQGDGHKAANQMGIAVTTEMKMGRPLVADSEFALDPYLADTASNFVDLAPRAVIDRFERAPEFDQIAVAIFPILQESKVVADGVDCRQLESRRWRSRAVYSASRPSNATLAGRLEAAWLRPLNKGNRLSESMGAKRVGPSDSAKL